MEELCREVVGSGTTLPTRIGLRGALRISLGLKNSAKLTFVRNRGELAEGWYDPTTRQKAIQSFNEQGDGSRSQDRQRRNSPPSRQVDTGRDSQNSDDDLVGPALPSSEPRGRGSQGMRAGPAIPNMQDLELQRGSLRLIVYVEYARSLNEG